MGVVLYRNGFATALQLLRAGMAEAEESRVAHGQEKARLLQQVSCLCLSLCASVSLCISLSLIVSLSLPSLCLRLYMCLTCCFPCVAPIASSQVGCQTARGLTPHHVPPLLYLTHLAPASMPD